jgi:hypothetical protein
MAIRRDRKYFFVFFVYLDRKDRGSSHDAKTPLSLGPDKELSTATEPRLSVTLSMQRVSGIVLGSSKRTVT